MFCRLVDAILLGHITKIISRGSETALHGTTIANSFLVMTQIWARSMTNGCRYIP
jgi:hypothetical protein